MKTRLLKAAAVIGMAVMLSACGQDAAHRRAGRLLEQARTQYNNSRYDEALATIDSLRENCPKEFEARKAALRLYQEIELKRAQLNVEAADKAVGRMTEELAELSKAVERLKKDGNITAGDLSALTRRKLRLDSAKAVFDAECAKIRYIRKKMAE